MYSIGVNMSYIPFLNKTTQPPRKHASPPKHALPVSEPVASNDKPSRSCKDRFVVVHTIKEAGESHWAPWWLLLITRLLSCASLFGLEMYSVMRGPLFNVPHIDTKYGVIYIRRIYHFGSAFTFFLLVICTALSVKGSNIVAFPTLTLQLHGIFSVLSLDMLASLVVLLFTKGLFFTTAFIPFALYLFDILVMHSRMRLRYRCAVIGWFFTVLFDLFIFLTKTNTTVSTIQGSQVGWMAGRSLILLVLSLLAIGISRIRWPCFKESQSEIS